MWLLSALLTLRFCDSTSFTSSWPVCAGERVQFSCTVEDYDLENLGNTYWRTTNSSFNCSVSHRIAHRYGSYKDICGPFTAWLKKQGNNSYFSNFTAIATTDLNNSLVQCLGPNHRSDNLDLVGRDTIKITGQFVWFPFFPMSCMFYIAGNIIHTATWRSRGIIIALLMLYNWMALELAMKLWKLY